MRALRQEIPSRKDIGLDEPIFARMFSLEHTGKKATRAAGLDMHGLTAHHVTRHTAATLAGDAGASLAEWMALASGVCRRCDAVHAREPEAVEGAGEVGEPRIYGSSGNTSRARVSSRFRYSTDHRSIAAGNLMQ